MVTKIVNTENSPSWKVKENKALQSEEGQVDQL